MVRWSTAGRGEVGEGGAEERDWAVRAFVYRWIVERGGPPTAAEAAAGLGMGHGEARAAYAGLHARHALFLEPGSGGEVVRMAHPFSGVETPFRVEAGGRSYWANCAWDALGIPAALGMDARIAAPCAEDGGEVEIRVEGGAVRGGGEVVHVLRPFRRWYEDLVFT